MPSRGWNGSCGDFLAKSHPGARSHPAEPHAKAVANGRTGELYASLKKWQVKFLPIGTTPEPRPLPRSPALPPRREAPMRPPEASYPWFARRPPAERARPRPARTTSIAGRSERDARAASAAHPRAPASLRGAGAAHRRIAATRCARASARSPPRARFRANANGGTASARERPPCPPRPVQSRRMRPPAAQAARRAARPSAPSPRASRRRSIDEAPRGAHRAGRCTPANPRRDIDAGPPAIPRRIADTTTTGGRARSASGAATRRGRAAPCRAARRRRTEAASKAPSPRQCRRGDGKIRGFGRNFRRIRRTERGAAGAPATGRPTADGRRLSEPPSSEAPCAGCRRCGSSRPRPACRCGSGCRTAPSCRRP